MCRYLNKHFVTFNWYIKRLPMRLIIFQNEDFGMKIRRLTCFIAAYVSCYMSEMFKEVDNKAGTTYINGIFALKVLKVEGFGIHYMAFCHKDNISVQ